MQDFGRRLTIEPLENRRVLATVNTPFDVIDPNDEVVSIREAIEDTPVGGTVDFASSLNGETIELLLGQIELEESLTIDASMLSLGITIDGGDNGIRIFNITDPIPGPDAPLVTMIGLTLTRGDAAGDGGAIRSEARLVMQDCTVSGNEASGNGGAIFVQVADGGMTSREVLRIEDCAIENNVAGAAYVDAAHS